MDREEMYTAWELYKRTGTIKNGTREEILESWERCEKMHISQNQTKARDVLSEIEFREIERQNETFITYSERFMRDLYEFIEGFGLAIAISDKNGVLLRVLGDEHMVARVAEGNFIQGAVWSEESAGTNAISMALYLGTPIQVLAHEHYCVCSQNVSCSTVPIKDSQYNALGTISIVERRNDTNRYSLSLAVASAIAIEYCIIMVQTQRYCQVANEYKRIIIDSINQGIIAVDSRGSITQFNNFAKKMLQYGGVNNFIGRNIFTIFPNEKDVLKKMIDNPKSFQDRELTLTGKYRPIKFMVNTYTIENDSGNVDVVLMLEEISHIKKVANKMTNAVAALSFSDLIGEDENYVKVLDFAKSVANSNSSVLLLGESGTGKDVIAQAMHNESSRSKGPFVAINCGAIPRELIASELFGYEEGAFTGARKGGNPGKFELSDGGTIFLDEIGEMPVDLQATLLRVIEEHAITRVGGNNVIPIDVRIISATNKNLIEEIKKGLFRSDLYYRLNVMRIDIPALRERKGDIRLLAQHFVSRFCSNMGIDKLDISEEYLEALLRYDFPGNIRELQNIIERGVNTATDGIIQLSSIPKEVSDFIYSTGVESYSKTAIEENNAVKTTNEEKLSLEDYEKKYINELLDKHKGNLSLVAKEMNVARSTLYRRMKKYNIS